MAQQISLGCNTFTSLTATSPTSASLAVVTSEFGVFPLIADSYSNGINLVDNDPNNFAIKNAAAITGEHWIEVRDNSPGASYPGGSYAGFVVNSAELVAVGGAVTITTYLGAVEADSKAFASLLSVDLGGGRSMIGFITRPDKPFNRIRFTYNSTISLGTIRLYNAVAKRFCNGPALACNTPTILDQTVYPVAIDQDHTGITGIACVGCSVANAGNVIDGSATTAATISLSVSVGSTASVSVKNQLQTYPINTFAGFDIETQSLVSASLLGSATITLYNNGSAVQAATGNNLILGAGASALIGGNTRQVVGISSTVPAFNEVQISFVGTGADLGVTKIYSAISQSACEGIVLCNTTNYIQNPAFPAVINSARTGVTGAVCALCGVSNAANLISASTTDFASLTSSVGVGAQTSISVQSTVGTYPAGSYAGFVIQKNNLPVAVSLFNSLTISTYNDGVLQESSTSGGLLNLSLLVDLAGVPNGSVYNVGFATTRSFDEIRISVGALVNGFDQYINVYSAFVDTRTAFGGTLACFSLNPDFAVTTKNVPVSGNVKTNDIVGTGVTYGTPVAVAGNPNAAIPAMNADGSYTFTTALPGSYTFTVPVCPASQTADCPTSTLTITVLDQAVTTNKPVVNPDYASTVGSPTSPTAVTINVKANDGPGNPGGVLGTPTISSPPASGIATVNGSGNIVYTPAAGAYGINVFTYQVCEMPGGLCSSATVTVTVKAPSSTSIATTAVATNDDYISTTQNASVTGNVLTNDSGTGLTVSNAGTITSPGKGTLIITSAGSYTFTPTTGVTGPVDFTYTACDGGAPASCGTATLHILVKNVPDLVVVVQVQPSTQYGTSNFTVNGVVFELNSVAVTGQIKVYVTKDPLFVLSFDGTATSVGGQAVNNSVWTFDASIPNFYVLTTNAGVVEAGSRYGLTGVFTPGNTRGSTAISSLVAGATSGEVNLINNSDADIINYFNK